VKNVTPSLKREPDPDSNLTSLTKFYVFMYSGSQGDVLGEHFYLNIL